MYEHFADWYSLVAPQFDAKRLENRWQAAEAYADSLAPSRVPEAIRAILNRPNVQQEQDAIRQHAKKIDTTYISMNDGLELRVISAGAIAHLLAKKSEKAVAAALSMMCATFQQASGESFVVNLRSLSEDYLISEGRRLRSEDFTLPTFTSKMMSDLVGKQAVPGDLPTTQSNLVEAIGSIAKSLGDYVQKANQALARAQLIQREESDILWWITGGHSLAAGLPVAKLKRSGLPLIAAYDLASITRVIPGPVAAEALLHRTVELGHKGKENVTFRKAVNAVELSLKQAMVFSSNGHSVSGDVIPCHLAIQKAVDVAGGEDWETAFSTLSHIDPTGEVRSTALALQAYRERLLFRTINQH
jgi:hypothetical protein